MNESESHLNPAVGSENEDLRGEVQSLRLILSMSLLMMCLLSSFLFIFLFHQTRMLRRQVDAARDEIGKLEASGAMNQAAELMVRLGEYAKTHPDYMPIYQKYSQHVSVHQTENQPAKK